jgi:catechol 2,3-dioxygenase-like lactoylglutathione lyase family enzyme
MAPRTGAAPTLCGPLVCVTLLTNDRARATDFMTTAMQLPLLSDVHVSAGDAARRSAAWGLPLTITRPDGSSYVSGEILFRGPEEIYMLAVGRPADMTPVGPIDPESGMGGPAYSAIVVPDAEREIKFYETVLGWEARQNLVLTTSGPAGGLGLDAGAQFRFVQLFAPGATTAYICLLDMLAGARANPVAPRLPNRGLLMWTFGTRAFDQVARRVRDAVSARLCSEPRSGGDPGKRAMTLLSPAGVMIEVVEH